MGAQAVANSLNPQMVQKMVMAGAQWNKVKSYKMILPEQCPSVKFFEHLETGIVIYDDPFVQMPKTNGIRSMKAKLEKIFMNPKPRGNELFKWFGDYAAVNCITFELSEMF